MSSKTQDEETVDNFIVRLSKLSLGCDFKDESEKNDMIRDQVVDCCKSTELRKKLLSESELTLHKIPTVSRMFELSSSHAKKMAENNQTLDTKSGDINRLNGANVNKPCHVTPTGTTQRRETNVRLDIIRIGRITLATRRRARERQGNVTHGLQLNAIVAEEKVTMVGSVNVLKT